MLLSIGDFAAATHLGRKTLRHYHAVGLLEPVHVDPHTGYRYYAPEQVDQARLIRRLRSLDLPLEEVRRATTGSGAQRRAVLERHLGRMRERLDETAAIVGHLEQALDPATAAAPVEVVRAVLPATWALVAEEDVPAGGLGAFFSSALARLRAEVASAGLEPTGPYAGCWGRDIFLDGSGHGAVLVPLADGRHQPADGSLQVAHLSAVDVAVAVHRGSDDQLGDTYARVGRHVAEQGIGGEGPIRETYVSGFPGAGDELVTEVAWPVGTATPTA